MTNLLIGHTKHLNLNFKISLAKYFTLFLLTSQSLDHEIEAQSLVYAVIDEVKVLDHGSNFYGRFYQATGPVVFVDLNQVQCVIA